MTSLNTRPDWTPGVMGRHADELARVTASPKGWIYTPPAPNASQIEIIKAIRQLDAKQTALTDAGTLPTFTSAFSASAFTGGVLSTIGVGVAGTGYGTANTNVAVTVGATGEITAGTAHATSTTFGLINGFVVDTAGSYNAFPSITVVAGAGVQATGTLTMGITGFTVTNAGTGYGIVNTAVPATVTLGGGTVQATASATSDVYGTVVSVQILTPGSGYTSLPTITLGASAGVQATATATTLGVDAVATPSGSGYPISTTQTATFTGGGGSGATGDATIDGAGNVTSITITNPGTGYTSVPTGISVTGGGGAVTGTITMRLLTATVGTAGTGYATPATAVVVTLTLGGAATQATAHAVSDAFGVITSLVLDTAGTGYTSLPTIAVAAGAGTQSTATGLYGLASIAIANAGTGYATINSAISVSVTSGNPTTAATAHAVSDAFGVLASFVVDTAGSGYQFTPTITVGGPGTNGTGTPTVSAMHVATGAVLKVTLTASEAVNVAGAPSILVAIGAASRSFVYDSALSTTTSLVFKYTVVAGDVALITEVVSGAAVTLGTYDGIGDVLTATGGTNWLTAVTFTASNITNVSVN